MPPQPPSPGPRASGPTRRDASTIGVGEVGDGEMKMAIVDGTDQVLVINQAGEFTAVQGVCSHEYFELDKGFLTNGTLTCALHLSRFDLTNGEPLDLLAEELLAVYPVGRSRTAGSSSRSPTDRWRSARASGGAAGATPQRPPRPRAGRRWRC